MRTNLKKYDGVSRVRFTNGPVLTSKDFIEAHPIVSGDFGILEVIDESLSNGEIVMTISTIYDIADLKREYGITEQSPIEALSQINDLRSQNEQTKNQEIIKALKEETAKIKADFDNMKAENNILKQNLQTIVVKNEKFAIDLEYLRGGVAALTMLATPTPPSPDEVLPNEGE